MAFHVSAILLVGWLIASRVPLWPLLLPVQGVLLVFLFTLMHESIHRTAFATRRINDWVAYGCSLILALPAEWFRQFHLAHHRHTQDEQHDPELITAKPTTLCGYLVYVSGIPLWRSNLAAILRNAQGKCDDPYVPTSSLSLVKNEARWMLIVYALLAGVSLIGGSSLLLFVWILPVLIGQPFLRLYLLAEHGRCPFVKNAFDNTRTTLTNRLVRRLAWNMPYHAEHHAYPMVPFFRLGELHELTREHLSVTEAGYTKFTQHYLHDIVER